MTTLRDQGGSKVDRHQGVKSGPSLTVWSLGTKARVKVCPQPIDLRGVTHP